MLTGLLALALALANQQPPPPVVTEIRIQGNLATSDDELLRLAGVETGMPVGPTTLDEVAARLRATKRFERVEILQRFASIADPSQITLVIIVDEGPVHVELTGDPDRPTRVVRNRGPRLLILPLLNAEDGYGVSYGARLALADPVGPNSRVSFPLTWGGQKRAAVEIDKTIARGPVSRIVAGASIDRRTNPYFELIDDRRRVWFRGERSLTPQVRVAGTAGWQRVAFSGADDMFAHAGADIVVDTRIDPMLSRNAIYARAAWEHFGFPTGAADRTALEGRGYLGLFRQNVLVVRALRDGSDAPLPQYAKPLLGGMDSLRGFRAGTAAGDTLVDASAEVLVPLTAPLSFGKIGVSVFTDVGTAYNHDQRLSQQAWRRDWHQGVGAGVWFSAAFLRVNVAVAHGLGAGTRVHVGGGLSF